MTATSAPIPPLTSSLNILILGASYGSLLAIKCLAAGHHVTMTCRAATAQLMNAEGIRVRIPVKTSQGTQTYEMHSKALSGRLHACTPMQVGNLTEYDLVVLAMQEPQYGQEGIRELMLRVGLSGLPCMPIMNMPPLPYLMRLQKTNSTVDFSSCRKAYADATLWDTFKSEQMTLSSPDPQAFRPPDEPINVLQVSLPTNFKTAAFESQEHTVILQQLETAIEAVRVVVDGESVEVPVKLKVFDSLFVPLAKWSMLLTGNYRCIEDGTVRAIKDAVLEDKMASDEVYTWVANLCVKMGADPSDLVPFEKYANAASGLAKPSSAARALVAGSKHIERVDLLVQTLGLQLQMSHPAVDQTVNRVNRWLDKNRQA